MTVFSFIAAKQSPALLLLCRLTQTRPDRLGHTACFYLFQGNVFWRELLIRHRTCRHRWGESALSERRHPVDLDQLCVGLLANTHISGSLASNQRDRNRGTWKVYRKTATGSSNSSKRGWNLHSLTFSGSISVRGLPSVQTVLLYLLYGKYWVDTQPSASETGSEGRRHQQTDI